LANPAKSIDFGCDGFTASLPDWHELLQLTAPDKDCGIVFARGNFPNTPDAILARAQVRDDSGSRGTFDIHFLHEPKTETASHIDRKGPSGYKFGEKRAQGLANLRWPYMQYELERKGVKEARKGSYERISFIKDGTMFQVIRLRSGTLSKKDLKDTKGPDIQLPIKFRIGGKVQFGCPCSNGIEQSSTKDFKFKSVDGGYRLVYESKHYRHHLEIKVFINGLQTIITADETKSSGVIEVALSKDRPTFILTTHTLRDVANLPSGVEHYPMIPMASSTEIEDYLGISNTSNEMTDKLWLASLTIQFDAIETVEFCAIAKYMEQILGVSSVPIGASSRSSNSAKTTASTFEALPGIALIRNIMTTQYVDLESTL
jgi:hypothetical protein